MSPDPSRTTSDGWFPRRMTPYRGPLLRCSAPDHRPRTARRAPVPESRNHALEPFPPSPRSEEHTSELQSPCNLVCRLLLEKKKQNKHNIIPLHHHTTIVMRSVYALAM